MINILEILSGKEFGVLEWLSKKLSPGLFFELLEKNIIIEISNGIYQPSLLTKLIMKLYNDGVGAKEILLKLTNKNDHSYPHYHPKKVEETINKIEYFREITQIKREEIQMNTSKSFDKAVAVMKKLGKFTLKDIKDEVPNAKNNQLYYICNKFQSSGEMKKISATEFEMITPEVKIPEKPIVGNFIPAAGSIEAIIMEKILNLKKSEFGSFEVARLISRKYSKRQISIALRNLCTKGNIIRLRRGCYSLGAAAKVITNGSSKNVMTILKSMAAKAVDKVIEVMAPDIDLMINNLAKTQAEIIAKDIANDMVIPLAVEKIKKFMNTSAEDVLKMFAAEGK